MGSQTVKYQAVKIPGKRSKPSQIAYQQGGVAQSTPPQAALDDGMYYEIEYDSVPFPGVGKFVLREQKIVEPEYDEIRELFSQMRDIARSQRSNYGYSRPILNSRVQNENAAIFYQQGVFMKDFTDDYLGSAQLSQSFASYQMMGYEQLRSYFTWRTQVRKGTVTDTSLSCAFLYLFELLNNIGVSNPQDGLNKLVCFWRHFSPYNQAIDTYAIRWIKDYYIYYGFPYSWSEFLEKNELSSYYPNTQADNGADDDFELFCSISKYDIRKSAFYNDETSPMIVACFAFVLERIRQDFEAAGICFDDAFFRPTKKLSVFKPFRDAPFYHHAKQPDRIVVISKNEIYLCRENNWTSSVHLTSEKGRQFIGFVMKQMESTLRKATKHKFKLTATTDMVNEETLHVLSKAGLHIEEIVSAAVLEYYREARKTVISVNPGSLERIRQEALATQEALIVEDENNTLATAPILAADAVSTPSTQEVTPAWPNTSAAAMPDEQSQNTFSDLSNAEDTYTTPKTKTASESNIWDELKNALSETEVQALTLLFHGENIRAFADACGIMLEVLADGINEKAMDYIGDSLMDEDLVLYDDYQIQVGKLLE